MIELRQSTAAIVTVGPAIAIAGVATVAAVTVASITCGIVKNGATGASITLTASGGNNDMVPVASCPGYYNMEITTGNTDTLGKTKITFEYAAVMLPFWEDIQVLTQAEWDRKYLGTTGMSVIDNYNQVAALQTALASTSGILTAIQDGTSMTAVVAATTSSGVPLTASAVTAVWSKVLHGTRTALQIVGVTIPSFIIGKTTGGGSVGTIVFRDPDDGFDAISMDVDADGDRSSVATSYS